MKKRKISRDVLILAILTLITVLTWIGLDIHRIFFKEETVNVPKEQLEPLNPELDQEVINQISKKSFLERGQYLPPEIPTTEEATEEAEGTD